MQIHDEFEQLLGEAEVGDEEDEDENDDDDAYDDADGSPGDGGGMKTARRSVAERERLIKASGRGVGSGREVVRVDCFFLVVRCHGNGRFYGWMLQLIPYVRIIA